MTGQGVFINKKLKIHLVWLRGGGKLAQKNATFSVLNMTKTSWTFFIICSQIMPTVNVKNIFIGFLNIPTSPLIYLDIFKA